MVWRLWRRCFLTCVRIFNDVEHTRESWDLAHEDPGALGQDEDPLARSEGHRGRDQHTGSIRVGSAVGQRDDSFCRGVRCVQEVVVRVQDRSDLVSDLKPATCRARHGESQSNSELVGPLATLPLRPTVVEEAQTWRGQQEDRS